MLNCSYYKGSRHCSTQSLLVLIVYFIPTFCFLVKCFITTKLLKTRIKYLDSSLGKYFCISCKKCLGFPSTFLNLTFQRLKILNLRIIMKGLVLGRLLILLEKIVVQIGISSCQMITKNVTKLWKILYKVTVINI